MTITELAGKVAARYAAGHMEMIRSELGTGSWDKFWDRPTYANRAATKAFECGLFSGPPKSILDIGSGLHYFVVACELLGHKARGVEVDEEIPREVANAAWGYLPGREPTPIPIVFATVLGQEPLSFLPPPIDDFQLGRIGLRFDLVTIFGVNFCDPQEQWWDAEDYKFLMSDLWERLNPGGFIHIEHNFGDKTKFLETIEFDQPYSRSKNVIRIGPHP